MEDDTDADNHSEGDKMGVCGMKKWDFISYTLIWACVWAAAGMCLGIVH